VSAAVRGLALALVLGIAGAALAFWLFGEDIRQLASIPLHSLAIGIALVMANYLGGGLRLKLLCRRLDADLDLVLGIRAHIVGLFAAAASPGGSGQVPAQMWMLARAGVPGGKAGAATIYSSVLDLFFFAWAVPLSLVLVARNAGDGGRLSTGPWLIAAAVGAALFFFLFAWALARHVDMLERPLRALMSLPGLERWREDAVEGLHRIHEAIAQFRAAPLSWQLGLYALNAITFLCALFVLPVVAWGLGAGIGLGGATAAALLPYVAGLIAPTPGGAGLVELGTAGLLDVQGATSAATATAWWRLLVHYIRFPLGLALGGPSAVRAARGRAGASADPDDGRDSDGVEQHP
jgi:uncharacterized protein (TIRG00374 family)